ncbi:MAG: hypothetical protein ACRDN8_17615 [Thermoleophilaceae bacterium]
MRIAAIGFTACAALALTAPPAAAPSVDAAGHVAPAAAFAASCASVRDPLFGTVRIDGTRVLARIRRRTLRPRAVPRVPLPRHVYGWNWDFSPACDAVALAERRGRILLVDLERGRRIGFVNVGTRSAAGQIAWPRPDRLIAFAGPYRSPHLVTISVPDGRVVATRRVGGNPGFSEATSLGMAVVVGPIDGIGAATLVLATPDGGMLRVPVPEIRAGLDRGDPRRQLGRQLTPGLAVDEAAGRAYVVAANEPLVAEVDLASGVVAYHQLRGAGGTAGSPMAAKGLVYGAYRTAGWVGDGTIAVAGEVTRTRRDWRRAERRGQLATRIDPHGLQLIRTADWTVTTLNPLLRWFTRTGDVLLGMDSIPVSRADSKATGLVAYGTDGRRLFTRFRGDGRAGLRGASWPYAYVTARRPRRTYVIDLRTGRTANVIRSTSPPILLVR